MKPLDNLTNDHPVGWYEILNTTHEQKIGWWDGFKLRYGPGHCELPPSCLRGSVFKGPLVVTAAKGDR